LQWEYIAMSYKSVLAKSANAEVLEPLAMADMLAVAARFAKTQNPADIIEIVDRSNGTKLVMLADGRTLNGAAPLRPMTA
jgi:hypothetical protein